MTCQTLQRATCSAGLSRRSNDAQAHPTISPGAGDILRLIKQGRVQPRPGIAAIDGRTMRFTDGTSEDVDVIVCATGGGGKPPSSHGLHGENQRSWECRAGCLMPWKFLLIPRHYNRLLQMATAPVAWTLLCESLNDPQHVHAGAACIEPWIPSIVCLRT